MYNKVFTLNRTTLLGALIISVIVSSGDGSRTAEVATVDPIDAGDANVAGTT